MRRSFWSRLVAGWLACWVPLVLADGGGLHACPMHGYAVRDGAGMTPRAASAETSTAMPPMAMPDMVERSPVVGAAVSHATAAPAQGRHASGPHAPHSGGHHCTCPGACCATLAVLPVGPAPVTVAVVEQAPVAPTGRPEHEYVAAWVDFVLPFATAPPARG